jgi:hypothetical protein
MEVAVARELTEETGVDIKIVQDQFGNDKFYHNGEECILEPFYAFESSSMRKIDIAPPTSGHLIIFFRIKLNQKASQIHLQLDPHEVDGAIWLEQRQIQ